ncbi:hypothetical protein LCGC14_1675440 [marine sediment metagenome]|uniref:Uncharacterized protein n=1 Tax=marine sediment metagenome TaxID=412755 RepID=A0A0F9HQ69_9ZZZZ
MGFGSSPSFVPVDYQVVNPRPPEVGPSRASLLQGATSLLGGAAKFAGGYLAAQNQFTAARAEATLMRSEADIADYNADIARWEAVIAEQERDIEIDLHRDSVAKIMGKQATFFAWGNIDLGDPKGTPAQVRLRSLYNAEYNEGIIIERGEIKKKQALGKAAIYDYKASVIRSAAPLVEAGGKLARTGAFISLTGEALKDIGAISS